MINKLVFSVTVYIEDIMFIAFHLGQGLFGSNEEKWNESRKEMNESQFFNLFGSTT